MNAFVTRRRARLVAGFAPQAAAAATRPGGLDIAEIRHFPVREPVSGNRYSLLRVKTRTGLTVLQLDALGSSAGGERNTYPALLRYNLGNLQKWPGGGEGGR